MNNDLAATKTLISELIELKKTSNSEIMIAPTFVNLLEASKLLKETSIKVVSQNIHQKNNGAYTGEVSSEMLKSIGVNNTLIGHSERRAYFNETDDVLLEKIEFALNNNLNIIFCFGEELSDRKSNNHFKLVKTQLDNTVLKMNKESWKNIILAYEPVWAIGTGETATPEQAQEMHEFVRNYICECYDNSVSDNVSILYGGSVKPSNASEIFNKNDVDGGLIGGASLSAKDFNLIIEANSSL
jgi:triosephosphate isomerase